MILQIFKLLLCSFLLFVSIWDFYLGNIGNGIFFVLLSGLVLFLYFKNELIILAFIALKKQKFEKAKKYLGYIKNPKRSLIKSQQAYYYYLLGLIETQNNISKADNFLKKSLSLGLKMKHNRAMAKINLAGIAISRRRKREATNLLNEAKKIDSSKLFDQQIKMMKNQLKRI